MTDSKFTLGSGELLTPVSEKEAEHFRSLGLHELSARENHVEELKKAYSSWLYAPEAAALGIADAVLPGATSAVVNTLGAISPELGQTTGDFITGVKAGSPAITTASQVAGSVVGGLEGLAVKGLGKIGAAVGLGALGGAARSADSMALEHINTPEGAEKVAASLGIGALIGGVTNAAAFKVGSWVGNRGLGKLGQQVAEGAETTMAGKTVGNAGVQAKLAETGATDKVTALVEKYALSDKSPKIVRAKTNDILRSAEVELNQAKGLTSDALLSEQAALTQQLQGSGVKVGKNFATEPQTLGDLHQMRIGLDKKINWKDPSSETSQKLIAARDSISSFMDRVVETAGKGTDFPERWAAANADYGAAKSLQDAMRYSEATGKSFLSRMGGKLEQVGKYGLGGSVAALNPQGAALGAAGIAGGKALQAVGESNAVPMTVFGLGKSLQAFDNHVVQSIASGLERSGAKVNGAAAAELLFGLTDYDTISTGVKWASENPTTAVPHFAEQLEGRNVPGPVIDAAVPTTIRAAQYLNSVAPKDPFIGSTIAPFAYKPTLKQKAEFMDKVNAVNNPMWAINNPTEVRLGAVQAIYPELAGRVSQITAQQAAARAGMTLAARKWAAAVAGLPATPLATPQGRSALAMAGQAQMPQQQGGVNIDVGESRTNRMAE